MKTNRFDRAEDNVNNSTNQVNTQRKKIKENVCGMHSLEQLILMMTIFSCVIYATNM